MPGAHARRPPSDSENWPLCPGKAQFCEDNPEDPNDPMPDYTLQGIRAHSALAYCLSNGVRPETLEFFVDEFNTQFEVDPNMKKNIQLVIDYIMKRQEELKALGPMAMRVEVAADAGRYLNVPQGLCWGTTDIALICGRFLEVIDYKNGVMFVDAKFNSQTLIYAASIIQEYQQGVELPFDRVRCTIIQPNCFNADPIRSMEYKL